MKNLIYLMILFIMGSCSNSESSKDNHQHSTAADETYTAEQLQMAGISFGNLQKEVIETSISCNGVIDVPPQNKADVVAPLGGIVSNIRVYPTEAVKKGQVLCEITGQQYIQLQQRFLSAKAQLAFAEADFERKSVMFNNEATSEKEYQNAKNALNQAKAELSGTRSELKFCGFSPTQIETGGIQQKLIIKSPTNGYITDVNVTQGKAVDAQTSMISIINKEHMHLELTVFEKDISKLKLNQHIRFQLEGDSTQHTGEVFLIGESLNTNNRSVNVHGHLERENAQFKPGMFVSAQIITHADTLLALPKNAAIQVGSGYEVYVKQSNGEVITEPFEVEYQTEAFLVPTDAKQWKNKNVALKGVYQLQEAEAGHNH